MVKTEDHLADFTRDRRILVLSLMAVVIGTINAVVAYVLVWLIVVITNLAFYQTFSAAAVSPVNHRLGYWVIFGRSRMEPKVALTGEDAAHRPGRPRLQPRNHS